MNKVLYYPAQDAAGLHVFPLYPGDHMNKLASELSPEVLSFVETMKKDPEFIYLLVNAMGAGESWGANINGDYFPREELGNHHGSFLDGYVYRHHINKDPLKSFGRILYSLFNPDMDRVELVVSLNKKKAPDLIEEVENGRFPDVSMGTKVKYDVCSICHNKAKTRKEYCDHLKHMMNKVLDDGRRVFAINPAPRFFDLSFVLRGADRSSGTLAKVASHFIMSSALMAEKLGLEEKSGDIKKEVPMTLKPSNDSTSMATAANRVGVLNDAPMSPESLKKLLGAYSMEQILASMAANGIVLTPEEFQHTVLSASGKDDVATSLHKSGSVFTPDGFGEPWGFGMGDVMPSFQDNITEVLLEKRSCYKPFLIDRLRNHIPMLGKLASVKEAMDKPLDESLAKLYGKYLSSSGVVMGQAVPESAIDPRFIKVLNRQFGYGPTAQPKGLSKEDLLYNMLIGLPILYLVSRAFKGPARIVKKAYELFPGMVDGEIVAHDVELANDRSFF